MVGMFAGPLPEEMVREALLTNERLNHRRFQPMVLGRNRDEASGILPNIGKYPLRINLPIPKRRWNHSGRCQTGTP